MATIIHLVLNPLTALLGALDVDGAFIAFRVVVKGLEELHIGLVTDSVDRRR